MTTLNLHAKQDYLEREARSSDPLKALGEFVWNSLDAEATRVKVTFVRNDLGGITGIEIQDNGHGIAFDQAHEDFGNLGDSWKRKVHRTSTLKRAIHGKEGRGRLRFFSLARSCTWATVIEASDGFQGYEIKITSNSLEKCDISDPSASTTTATGNSRYDEGAEGYVR